MKSQKMNVNKCEYTLETLSTIVISPRSSFAFYKGVDFGDADLKNENMDVKNIKIIYPFYQYGVYDQYSPEEAKYYLPGSSIKGALKSPSYADRICMVDDIPLSKDDITLRILHKAQYLHPQKNTSEDKEAKFGPFFESVGVEMIKANRIFTGTFFVDDDIINKILDEANEETRNKIEEMIAYMTHFSEISDLSEITSFKNRLPVLKKYVQKLQKIINHKEQKIILLGGYKGLLLSINKSISDVDKGAIYLDPQTLLPHGIVRITLKK